MEKLKTGDFKKLIMELARRDHTIRSASIELLDRCNYYCPHCYVHDTYTSSMAVDSFCRIIDELVAQGCIWLLLTGGEPLLHPKFFEMYQYAYKQGLKITVFTNGYFLNKRIQNLFLNMPPEEIEISLYGGTADTFNAYVGVVNAFETVLKNIDDIVAEKLNLKLKTVVLKNNIDELQKIKNIASERGIPFRFDGYILPKVNGDKEVLDMRVDISQLLKLESENSDYLDALSLTKNKAEETDALYTCAAGYNSVFIDASCKLYICIMARNMYYDLLKTDSTIKKGQKYLIHTRESRPVLLPCHQCYKCTYRAFCKYCPAQFALITGNEYQPPEWVCLYAKGLHKLVYKELER